MSDHPGFGPDEPVRVRVTDKRRAGEVEPPRDEAVPEEPAADGTTHDDVDELEAARAEAAAHLEDLQRLKAEFDNYRKRMVREQTSMIERATETLVERMLPILDNFELALIAADQTKDIQKLVRGVEMVYGEFLDMLQKEGLERIAAIHRPFDPELHEAVMRGEGEGDEMIVVEELRPGYKIGGRVVRPSMVKVAPGTKEAEHE